MTDADRLVHDLHHRREAVGGAGRRGDDGVAGRVVESVVHADDDVEDAVELHRCRHDHPLRAAVDMALQYFRGEEFAGAVQHHVNTEVTPWNRGRMRVGGEGQAAVADMDRLLALGGKRRPAPAALHAIEFEEVGACGSAALNLVEMDNFEPVAAARVLYLPFRRTQRRAQSEAADAAHAADADAHRHALTPPPISSSRLPAAMRSSEAKGKLINIRMRRSSAA